MRIFFLTSALLLFLPVNATAHEFWIDVHDYTVTQEEKITADLRVGQNFEGGKFGFIPANFDRFDVIIGENSQKVRSRIGNRPAMDQAAQDEGLAIIVHETTDQRLTYTQAELFLDFISHKDLTGTLEAHRARGLPDAGFIEHYRRFAKSLVAVGAGAGADRAVGLRTELVALENPYDEGFAGNMRLRLLFEGQPRPNSQIEIFDRDPSGTVTVSLIRTDAAGEAQFPVAKGHEYLADAVKMLPLEADDPTRQAVWLSLWASLTFAVPK